VLVLAALQGAATPAQRGVAGRHVVLVSIDGFAAYHLDHPSIELPNIRALVAAGTRAASSETVFPSVTHPSHTSIITGVSPREHGVVNNNVRDRETGERFHITNLPRRESVQVPTLFDAVHGRGGRTASFFWPETKNDPSIDDNIAEAFGGDGPHQLAVTPGLLDELRKSGVPIDAFYTFYDDPFTQGAADIALTRAAAHVFKTRKPALTALHLLVTDKVQHEFGPGHFLTAAALMTADHCVGLLRQAAEEAGVADRTTFVIVADHGFVTVRDEMNIAPLLKEPALDGHVRWVAERWFVTGELLPTFDRERHGSALERVLARIAAAPGIVRVIRPGEFEALGYPEFADNRFVPGHYLIAANIDRRLVLEWQSNDTALRPRKRPYHGHGYFPDHPSMFPALVLSGAGVKPGRTMGHVRNIDVAPTIAALLGVDFPTAKGRVLHEVLAAAPGPASHD
jgi:predicted AlkP superfamily pyrophosphatase or phosphodiesterase